MSDITDQTYSLEAVERIMGRRVIPGGEARTAILRRHYQAPVQDVWDAITTPDRLDRFFPRVGRPSPRGSLQPREQRQR
jgi:hypothetical protein